MEHVNRLTEYKIQEYCKDAGVEVKDLPREVELRGCYSHETKTIYINPRLVDRERIPTILHELMHHYRGDVGRQPASVENRINERVATLLIDSSKYREAELMYDGEVHAIADHLDTVVWVVEAYQRTLSRAWYSASA